MLEPIIFLHLSYMQPIADGVFYAVPMRVYLFP